MPPLPEGCAITAVALPLRVQLTDHALSGDANTQCCLGLRGVLQGGEERCFGRPTQTFFVDLIKRK